MTMADHQGQAAPNRIEPVGDAARPRARTRDKGDVPATVLDRYLVERDGKGRAERFYRDHRAAEPSFRDTGGSLQSSRTYPDSIADMLKIAQHRGWSSIRVQGEESFRREVWIQARALGLEVKGHRPTERDRQAAGTPGRDRPPPPGASRASTLENRLDAVAAVVRTLAPDPEMQARLIRRALERAAPHLERLRGAAPADRERARGSSRER